MTNVNVYVTDVAPIGGASNAGWRLGIVDSKAKLAVNDTWTVANASACIFAIIYQDAGGAIEGGVCTGTTNVITMAGASTSALASGLIVYIP